MNTAMENTDRHPGYWLRAIGRSKRRLTHEYRAGLGETAREGISDEDYATTMATLEKMARNLGWDESAATSEATDEPGRHGHGFRRHGRRGFGYPSRYWAPEA